jgi:site-specific recombinase XerC
MPVLCLTAFHQIEVTMENLVRQDAATEIAIHTVLDSLDCPHSKRAYERHLREFITWHKSTGLSLCKATVQRYSAQLRESGSSAATINQRLCAIRKLAEEAADNGALDPQIANGIRSVASTASADSHR